LLVPSDRLLISPKLKLGHLSQFIGHGATYNAVCWFVSPDYIGICQMAFPIRFTPIRTSPTTQPTSNYCDWYLSIS